MNEHADRKASALDTSGRVGSSGGRRLLDVVTSLVGLILLSPLFLLVAVAIKLDSAGPVFYRALRVGRNGRPFRVYKFRSMVNNADRGGPGITTADDERVTELGRLLRRTKVDELPQLINVFRGDMSLVGPRPEDPRYVALYTREQRRVLAVRPGITGPASVHYRHEEELLDGPNWEQVYIQEVMPHKLQIELDYLERRTLWTDLGVILQTMMTLLR
jgi:lipopolysaccharide/colanic/teichoic acid biosynthesis glycosyltransferase